MEKIASNPVTSVAVMVFSALINLWRLSLKKKPEKILRARAQSCNTPGLLQESLRPFGPEVSRECLGSVPRGVSGALRAPGSGVSKKCPESVPRVSGTPF